MVLALSFTVGSLRKRLCVALLSSPVCLAGCGGGGGRDSGEGTLTIHFHALRQRISGFGASSAWTAPNIDDALADELFSVDSGIGLSLLRLRISPEGTSMELGTAEKAQARGAGVWAAPWSPPGAWKDNGDPENGGSLLPDHYGDWAERLASFARTTEDQGIPLMAISAQNEPDYEAEWETCRWTPEQLREFIAEHLVPALEAAGASTQIIAPEVAGWRGLQRFGDVLLADPATRDAVAFVALHGYNGDPFSYTTPAEHGKELWMTEVSESRSQGGDVGMTSALWMARMLHDDLTIAGVSAWHYWWLLPRTDAGAGEPDNGALLHEGELTRRAHVLGNYSKFVRPGWHRVDVAHAGAHPGVFVTAYRSAEADRLAVVAINAGSTSARQHFDLEGAVSGELTPWMTNDARALAMGPSVAGGARFDYELPPRSVTTFVGSVSAE